MRKVLAFALPLLGFSCILAQVLLLREFFIIFVGNELSLGIILANWLILVALGSFLCSRRADKIKRRIETFALLQILISFVLPLTILGCRIIKNIIGVAPGEMVGVMPIFYSSFIILLPFCLIGGAQFTLGCKIFSTYFRKDATSIGRVYILEAIGSSLGGALFTYFLVHFFHPLEIAVGIGILNLISATLLLLLAHPSHLRVGLRTCAAILLVVSLYILISPWRDKLQVRSIGKLWSGYDIQSSHDSIYGNIVVARRGEQLTLFSNGIPISTRPTPDIAFIEELAHFPLLFHPSPDRVLLIGGGLGGIIEEILKHPVQEICYSELDPKLIKVAKKELQCQELDNPRVNLKYLDGRVMAARGEDLYDLILVNLPSPSTLQLNRFYTIEFFDLIKKSLKAGGIFGIGIPASEAYMSEETRNLNRSIYKSLKEVFPDISLIPGNYNLFLAEVKDHDPELLIKRWQDRELKTNLINPHYIRYKLEEEKVDTTIQILEDNEEIRTNKDFMPSGLLYNLILWNTMFYPRLGKFFTMVGELKLWWLMVSLLALTSIFYLIRRSTKGLKTTSIPIAIVTTGLAGIAFNIVLIFAFQILYGYVYQKIGILIASFMVGLTLGSWLMNRVMMRLKRDIKIFAKVELCLLIYPILLPLVFTRLSTYVAKPIIFSIAEIIFILLCGGAGLLVGLEFPLANKIYLKERDKVGRVAGTIYGADLAGAWMGALLIGAFIIPILGILQTCILLASLKAASLLLIITSPS